MNEPTELQIIARELHEALEVVLGNEPLTALGSKRRHEILNQAERALEHSRNFGGPKLGVHQSQAVGQVEDSFAGNFYGPSTHARREK